MECIKATIRQHNVCFDHYTIMHTQKLSFVVAQLYVTTIKVSCQDFHITPCINIYGSLSVQTMVDLQQLLTLLKINGEHMHLPPPLYHKGETVSHLALDYLALSPGPTQKIFRTGPGNEAME